MSSEGVSVGETVAAVPIVFRRSRAAHVGGSFGAAIGALLFGGFAVAILGGLLMEDLAARLLFGGMVMFFAVLMGASAVAAFRRGGDTRVAEIGPDGVWTPEMGLVPWDELARVQLESVAGPDGSRNSRIRNHRRLGLVPLDGSRRPTSAAGLAVLMTQGYLALVRRMAPDAKLATLDLAPFGISETELPKDFDRVLDAARRYVEIRAVDARLAPPAEER